MAKTTISAAIAEQQRARLQELKLDADGLTRLWSKVALADANEVVQHRRDCCRHCWGVDHAYQYTPAEFDKERIRHEQQRADILAKGGTDIGEFPSQQGNWFDARKRPNPECPECFGNGVPDVFIVDTRDLSEAGRALFAGVKEGRDGIEVKLHDQQAASEKLGRALGAFRDSAPDSSQANVDLTELALRFTTLMDRARERQLQVLRERGLIIEAEGD